MQKANINIVKNPIFLDNLIHELDQKSAIGQIHNLKQMSDFRDNLVRFWKLFNPNLDSSIPRDVFRRYLVILCHFLFPHYPKNTIEEIAEDKIIHLTDSSTSSINFDLFVEFFANMTYLWIEQNTSKNSLLFLNTIYERTTKIVLTDEVGRKNLVPYYIYVLICHRSDYEKTIGEKIKHFVQENDLIFEETIVYNQELIDKSVKDPNILVQRQILDYEEVLPLGFMTENVVTALINGAQPTPEAFPFSVDKEKGYKFIPISSEWTPNIHKVQIWTRGYAPVKRIVDKIDKQTDKIDEYNLLGMLFENFRKPTAGGLLNDSLRRKLVYRRLKNKQGKENFVNMNSAFYKFCEYNIDLVQSLHDHWEELKATTVDVAGINKNPSKENPYPFGPTYENLKIAACQCRINFVKYELENDFKKRHQVNRVEHNGSANSRDIYLEHRSRDTNLPFDHRDTFVEDLIDYAKQEVPAILAFGAPKSGISTLCQNLAQKLGIELISGEYFLNRILQRVKENEENPELDDDGNPKEFLNPLEREIMNNLLDGNAVPGDMMVDLYNHYLNQPACQHKGFILDLHYYEDSNFPFNWIDKFFNGYIRLPEGISQFTHVIHLSQNDDEVMYNANTIMELPENYKLTSAYDRELLRKPPKKQYDEDGNEIEPDPEQIPKPIEEKDSVNRACESVAIVQLGIIQYRDVQRFIADRIVQYLAPSRYIHLESSGLAPGELFEAILAKLGSDINPIRPICKKLEPVDDGSLKELLRQSLEENDPSRRWSAFGNIDPVALSKGRVVQGKGEFSCEYGGRVFVLETEENQKEFLDNPKRFLVEKPEMPKQYAVAVLGPRKSGKTTVANMLEARYGWQIIEVEKLVREKLQNMRTWTQHIPSHSRSGTIHPSEEEYKAIIRGATLLGVDSIPMILHALGLPLRKKPPKPIVKDGDDPDNVDGGGDGNDDDSKRDKSSTPNSSRSEVSSKKDEKKIDEKKAPLPGIEEIVGKEEERPEGEIPIEEQRPPTPPPEDLKLSTIGVEPDADGKMPLIKGFILVDFPVNEDQINALKEHNVHLDKIIYLVDNSEEEPGKILKTRGNYIEEFSLENELALSENILKTVKEIYGEEIVKEVPINYPLNEFFNQVSLAVDPFYIRIDREEDMLKPSELDENMEPIPWGEYGPYCCVTLIDEGWLQLGKEEFEVLVRGQRYRFYSEKDMEKFKLNVEFYVVNSVQRLLKDGNGIMRLPNPRILMMGVKGSGLHTQLNFLYQKYKIPKLELKEELLKILEREKNRRKKDRELMRGFKPKEINEETGEPIPDPEIEDDPADYDVKAGEITALKETLSNVEQVAINANMFDLEEGKLATPLTELLIEAKRLPDVCVFLKTDQVQEDDYAKRIINFKAIEDDYNRKMDIIREKKKQARLAKIKEFEEKKAQMLADGADPEEVNAMQFEEEPEEDDPDAPNLEAMKETAKSEILQKRSEGESKMDEIIEALKATNIKVVVLQSDKSLESIFMNMCYELREFVSEKRLQTIEKYYFRDLNWENLAKYENSYVYKKSKFGDDLVECPWKLPREKEYPFTYRNRIYYCSSEEERIKIKENIKTYIQKESIPKDVRIIPKIFIIGKLKSGKTSLAKLLAQKLGLIRIKVKHVLNRINEFATWHTEHEIITNVTNGNVPSDDQVIDMLKKRLQLQDCEEFGYVLDGFPVTKAHAIQLTQRGIIPDFVFSMHIPDNEIIERYKKLNQNKFGYNPIIINDRMNGNDRDLCKLETYYMETFDNLRYINTRVAKLGMFDQARKLIIDQREKKYNLTASLITGKPCLVSNIGLNIRDILHSVGDFLNYSPVALKSRNLYIRQHVNSTNKILYKSKIYFTGNDQETVHFMANPDLYINSKLNTMIQTAPKRLLMQELAEYNEKQKNKIELDGHCPVNLTSSIITKGLMHIAANYKNKIWLFKSEANCILFLENPSKYERAKVPEKYPLDEGVDKAKNLEKIKKKAENGDCTAYLEHHLGNITMKVLAQLGSKRLKYPTLSHQETALKFMAICLKANNPNKDAQYRKKYSDKLAQFIKHCNYVGDIEEKIKKREKKIANGEWTTWEEENYLKKMEEFHEFMKVIKTEEKINYFKNFIR